jgi:hypothetical protein
MTNLKKMHYFYKLLTKYFILRLQYVEKKKALFYHFSYELQLFFS